MVIDPGGGGRSSASAGALALERWAAAEAGAGLGPLKSPARGVSALPMHSLTSMLRRRQ
jgi:hypothetical protein